MRTSLTEIEQIENWLFKKGKNGDWLVTEARILSNPEIQDKVHYQSQTYELVQAYGREKLIKEIKAIENQLFHSPKHRSFQERIRFLFKSN